MALLGRMAGAIVVRSDSGHYLVGDLKEPCDFRSHGYEAPGEIRPLESPYIPLKVLGEVTLGGPFLEVDMDPEALARLAAKRFMIERNGSISERLWRIVTHEAAGDCVAASWLSEMPDAVWQIVRDSVLKCS